MTELSKVHRAVTVPLMLSVMFSHIQSTYLFKKSPLTSLLASNNLLKPTPDFYSKQQIINNSQSSIPKQTINQRIIRCTNKSYPFIPFYLIFDKIFLLLPLFFYCRLSWAFFLQKRRLFSTANTDSGTNGPRARELSRATAFAFPLSLSLL